MANHAYLKINNREISHSNWDIPIHFLIPFKPNDYKNGIFKTTIKTARKNYSDYGLSLEKVEKKISEIIRIDSKTFNRFIKTGIDPFPEDNEESLEMKFSFLMEDFPELAEIHRILRNLQGVKDSDVLRLDIKEIKLMFKKDEWYKEISDLFEEVKREYFESLKMINLLEDFKDFDFFICHDSKDKRDFVEPLAKKLKHDKKMTIWYDKFVLRAGDSLIDKINEGLKKSKFGIIVISNHFLNNSSWPHTEFISLKTREIHSGQKLIIPIWRNKITKNDVAEYNLELADRFALLEKNGLKSIVNDLEVKLKT